MNVKTGEQFIDSTKQTINKYRTSKSPLIKLVFYLLDNLRNTINTFIRVIKDKKYRSIFLLQIFYSKNVHQTTPLTYMNRYPKIFSTCRDFYHSKQDIKILSYGCSTGEEVMTLRHYFPNATIVGAEINKLSLEICNKLPIDDKISFIYSDPKEIEKHGPFDAIFCMAVLQRKPHYIAEKGIKSLKKIYPFEKFEQQILELDKLLNPNGLLIVHYTQYSLNDTSIAPKYKAYSNCNQDDYSSPVFDRESNIITNPGSQNSIYVKSQI
jgi:2-polyprenyl-3-methyl-5-hydroxy-6-metoxy-1,4-benzoquinol methylase